MSVVPFPSKSATGGCGDPTAATVTVIVSQSEAAPSETHTSKVCAPTWAPLGVQLKAPPPVIEAPAGTDPEVPLASEKVSVSPASGSLAVAVKASSLPAVAFLLPTGFRVGARVGRGHGDGDRLAVGGGAVGDAHVEGVRADLGAARRPAEGAPAGDRGARGHRPGGAVGEREGERVAGVGIARGGGEGELAAGGGVLVADRVSVGAVLAAATVTVIVSQSEAAPSETHTSKVCAPTWAPLGVQLKAPAPVIEAPAGTDPEVPLASEKVSVSPASGSLAVAVKASSLPAVAFLLPTGFRVGAELAAATVTVIVSQSEAAPSETHTSKVCAPTWAPLGVQLKAPPPVIEAPAGTDPEVPLASEKVSVSPASGSLAVAVKASSLPAVAFLLPTGFRVGAVLAAATVTVIVSQSEAAPSETHTSKVCAPTWAPLGVQLKAPAPVIEAPAGTDPEVPLASEKVSVSPASGSLAVAVKASSLPAVAFLLPTGFRVGARVGRGHGDGDRLAVGGGAVGDAHVEGVRADLGAARRPAEGAPAGDRGARGHRPGGAVGEREGERVAGVGIARGGGEGELAAGGGVLVADRVQGGRRVGRRQRGDLRGRQRPVVEEDVVHRTLEGRNAVGLASDAQRHVVRGDRRRGRLRRHLDPVHVQPDRRPVGGGCEVHPRGAVARIRGG